MVENVEGVVEQQLQQVNGLPLLRIRLSRTISGVVLSELDIIATGESSDQARVSMKWLLEQANDIVWVDKMEKERTTQ